MRYTVSHRLFDSRITKLQFRMKSAYKSLVMYFKALRNILASLCLKVKLCNVSNTFQDSRALCYKSAFYTCIVICVHCFKLGKKGSLNCGLHCPLYTPALVSKLRFQVRKHIQPSWVTFSSADSSLLYVL